MIAVWNASIVSKQHKYENKLKAGFMKPASIHIRSHIGLSTRDAVVKQ